MGDRVGQQLGNYQLIRFLGQGGFAEVYLGEQVYLKSQAALKVLRTSLQDKDVQRFLAEAQTLVRLRHPNIVRLLDFGMDGPTPFLVMDYAPSGTLRQHHPKGEQLPLRTIVGYVNQVANALQYAHDERLIHRDIKPENMLIGQRNEILLSDFGIAVIAHSERSLSMQEMAGTVPYMAPEQIRGKPRPASDQYALGVVAYEWITGLRPFRGSQWEIISQHIEAPAPPLREKVPSIPVAVEAVVLRALAKDPQARFDNVQAFATALEQTYQHSEQYPFTSPPGRTSSFIITLPTNSPSWQSKPNILSEQSGSFTETSSRPNQVSPPISPIMSQQPINTIAPSNNIRQAEDSISPRDQSLQSTTIVNPPMQTQKFLPGPFSQPTPQSFSQLPKYTRSPTASAKSHPITNRTFLGIGIVLTLSVLILSGVVGFVVLSNPAQTHNSGQSNTATSQGTGKTELSNSPTIQPIPLGIPEINLSNAVEKTDGTTYTLSALAVNRQNQPVHASNISCKLWLIQHILGHSSYDIPLSTLKDVNAIQNPITGYVNGSPFEEVTGLNFDSSTLQTHFCNANGQFTWKYQISSSITPGNYDLIVLTDWRGVYYNWSWVNIEVG